MSKYIAFFVPSFNIGGVERAFVNLANGFIANGHRVDFIVCHDIGELKSELDKNINIIIFKDSRLRQSVFQLYKYIKSSSSDCLITGPTYANIVAIIANIIALKKIKVIISQHSYQDIELENLGLIGKLAPLFIKSFYNFAHKVVAVSDGVRIDMINNYNVKKYKIVTIYNAVLGSHFDIKADAEQDFVFSKPYIVAVGRLAVVKNYLFMLRAYALIKKSYPDFDFNLVILGEGPERINLENEIKQLGVSDSVHLLGALKNPFPVIRQAKLFIHTSFSEAMPLVYVEALALKVPVVTVTNKGALEILNNVRAKKIIETHDESEFVDAIYEMLHTPFNDSDFPDLSAFTSEKIMNLFLSII